MVSLASRKCTSFEAFVLALVHGRPLRRGEAQSPRTEDPQRLLSEDDGGRVCCPVRCELDSTPCLDNAELQR